MTALNLLFISGSTGAPKGVLVRHRNVMAYLDGVAERHGPGPSGRLTQFFHLTFDLSAHDMFLCWSAGAALYCLPVGAKMAPRDFVRRHALTFWFSVPSAAAFMQRLRMLCPGDFPSLRWSLFYGEALPVRLALAWADALNSAVETLRADRGDHRHHRLPASCRPHRPGAHAGHRLDRCPAGRATGPGARARWSAPAGR